MLLFDVGDPRLKRVQITGVDVTPDLKLATVYYVVIDRESPEPDEEIVEALERSAGYLRKLLGDRMSTRSTPELRFEYDESIERGRRIEALLADLTDEEE